MPYGCPVPGCEYTCEDVDTLAGHIGGKAAHDDAHDDYGDVRRFELHEYEIQPQGRMNR